MQSSFKNDSVLHTAPAPFFPPGLTQSAHAQQVETLPAPFYPPGLTPRTAHPIEAHQLLTPTHGDNSTASSSAEQDHPNATAKPSRHPTQHHTTQALPMASRPSPAMKNQRIGPYVLGKTLGAGTTGLVKLAVHAETNQKVAIKIVKKDTSTHMDSDNSFNMKLEREITIMKLIQHPHIMQLYDVYETPTELFLVLEHIEGGELFDHLVKKGRLSEPEALQFFQQIIFGMEFVHRHMIIHRDLKPENLLLDKNMNIKIADFGMARMQLQGKMLDTSCGSPHYASPEVIRGIPYDGPATDIWSCGVILYALMAGHLPFDDENTVRLLAKIKAGFFVMPQHISPLAKDLVSKMLVIDPKRRITMDKIMSHPWFTSQRPVYDYPLATDHVYATQPVDEDKIDPEILAQLSLLGWGNERQLAAALLGPEAKMEKVFYHVLALRKRDFLENFDPQKVAIWDIDGGPRRRAESYSSLYSSRSELNRSEVSLHAPEPLLHRKSTEELVAQRAGQDPRRQHPSSQAGSATSPTPRRIVTTVSHSPSSVRINSPLAASTTALRTDDVNDKKAEYAKNTTRSSPELELPRGSPSSPSSASSTSPQFATAQSLQTRRSGDELRKKLAISIPSLPSASDSSNGAVNQEPGTPRFHRKKQEIPATPIITQTPKRSWFASLFNFKQPEILSISSNLSYEGTLTAIDECLRNCDVRFQRRKEGGFKCKYDGCAVDSQSQEMLSPTTTSPTSNLLSSPSGGPLTDGGSMLSSSGGSTNNSKAAKFKIEIIPEPSHGASSDSSEATEWRIQFVHQQGAYSVFQAAVERFHANLSPSAK